MQARDAPTPRPGSPLPPAFVDRATSTRRNPACPSAPLKMIQAACSCRPAPTTNPAPSDDSLTDASTEHLADRRSGPMVRTDRRCSPTRVAMHHVTQRHAEIVTAVSHAPNAHSWRHADGPHATIPTNRPNTSAARSHRVARPRSGRTDARRPPESCRRTHSSPLGLRAAAPVRSRTAASPAASTAPSRSSARSWSPLPPSESGLSDEHSSLELRPFPRACLT
jgi:hypothetical protein